MIPLLLAVNCNLNLEFMGKVKALTSAPVDAQKYVRNCKNFKHFNDVKSYWFHILFVQPVYVNMAVRFNFLGREESRKIFEDVLKMKYTKKASQAVFENHVVAGQTSGVIAKARMAIKNGYNVYVIGGIGASTCDMAQLHKTIHVPSRRMLCDNGPTETQKTVERGYEPHELKLVQDYLQQQAAQNLYDIGVQQTGITASNDFLEGVYQEECHKLRRWFREIVCSHEEMEDVPLHELTTDIIATYFNAIPDASVVARIQQVAVAAGKSSFFYSPNQSHIYVIAINREGENFRVHLSSFRVEGGMPEGAFAWSAGSWNLERPGRGTNPSSRDLMLAFPPLK